MGLKAVRAIVKTQMSLSHLYLGYWIEQSRKMAYKVNFQPIEGLLNNRWQRLKKR